MSWYVVFQLEGDANALVPSAAAVLRTYLRNGYWPVRRLQMNYVRGGRRAWALARAWAMEGRWAECMRVVKSQHIRHIRAIRGQGRPTLRSRFVQVITPPSMMH